MAPTSAIDESIPFVSPIPPIARLDTIIDPTATNPAASFHFHSDDERRRRIFRFLEGSSPFGARYEEFSIFLILLWVITSTVSSVFLSTSTYHVASDACDSWCDAVWAGIGSTVIVKTFVVGVFTIDYIMRIFTADLIDPAKYSGLLGRLRFMLTFFALVDLFSILPFYIDAFLLPNTELGGSTFLRMFRLLRMMKVEGRFDLALGLIDDVFYAQKDILGTALFVGITVWAVVSAWFAASFALTLSVNANVYP